MSQQTDVLIIGAGLSGLLTAYRLHQSQRDFVLLEARDRIGGRIHTVKAALDTPVEMGATWFGEKHQALVALLHELKIGSYPQYMQGKAYFEPFSLAPPQAVDIPVESPSYRITNGSGHLIHSLADQLPTEQIHLNQQVQSITIEAGGLRVATQTDTILAQQVVVTVPPALFVDSVELQGALPNSLLQVASHTHTWMRDSIKVALIYEQSFWRQQDLSGTLFSNVGPFTELYDHSDANADHFALCGFVSGSYGLLSQEERKAKIKGQLTRIFGEVAGSFIDYQETLWAGEQYTTLSSPADIFPHQYNGHAELRKSFLDGRLFFAGTETAAEFGG